METRAQLQSSADPGPRTGVLVPATGSGDANDILPTKETAAVGCRVSPDCELTSKRH